MFRILRRMANAYCASRINRRSSDVTIKPSRKFRRNGNVRVSSANDLARQRLTRTAYPPPRVPCVRGASRATVDKLSAVCPSSLPRHRRRQASEGRWPTPGNAKLNGHGPSERTKCVRDIAISRQAAGCPRAETKRSGGPSPARREARKHAAQTRHHPPARFCSPPARA